MAMERKCNESVNIIEILTGRITELNKLIYVLSKLALMAQTSVKRILIGMQNLDVT